MMAMNVQFDEVSVTRNRLEEVIYIFEYLKAISPRKAAPYPVLGLESSHNQVLQLLVQSGHIENLPGTDSFFLVKNPLKMPKQSSSSFTESDFQKIFQIRSIEELLEALPRLVPIIFIGIFNLVVSLLFMG